MQHGTGAQAARAAAVVQLLLGNIGVPGGGISYLGGAAVSYTHLDVYKRQARGSSE